ncbi:MAG: FHA domain-containing protein [Bdellovibrionales bacterium]|nr:FHA domain-containing protein [Bdellovibrionales bacterium]
MFALEITFTDGVSHPEMIFIRRPQALIGASDYAHVVIDDMKNLNYQLRIFRGLGRNFSVQPVAMSEGSSVPEILQGVYEGEATLDLGSVRMTLTALDTDLLLKENEPPDRAGVRILRQACAQQTPQFPAVVVPGIQPMVVSFVPDQPVLIGRSNQCALRLDASDISGKHARLGYESGAFWLEDLGSTNGTFVHEQQVSGRVSVQPGEPIVLGRDICIYGVVSEEQIKQVCQAGGEEASRSSVPQSHFPILLSLSEVARPAKLVLTPGADFQVGRDPNSDVWLGAPHISRHHCSIALSKTGKLLVTDHSMNGVAYDKGILEHGESLDLDGEPIVLNFGSNITLGVCFNEEQESRFIEHHGAPETFLDEAELARRAQSRELQSQQFTSSALAADHGGGVDAEQFRRVYKRLTFRQKLLLVLSAFCVVLFIFVLAQLLLPIIL